MDTIRKVVDDTYMYSQDEDGTYKAFFIYLDTNYPTDERWLSIGHNPVYEGIYMRINDYTKGRKPIQPQEPTGNWFINLIKKWID